MREQFTVFTISLIFSIALSYILINILSPIDPPIISPCPDSGCVVVPTAVPLPIIKKIDYKGTASYYSRAGCVGCSKTMTMANGQPLDDSKLTIAFNKVKLGTLVMLKNVKTDLQVLATVTDRGGFESLNRIADLSVATRDALGCKSLCEIEITLN